VAVTVLAAAASAVAAAWRATRHLSQVPVCLALLACAAAMVEATRDVRLSRDTMTRDLQEVWYLPIALLLPPVYVLLTPIPLVVMKQLRVHRNLIHRRVFAIASIGLGYGAASAEFHGGPRPLAGGSLSAGAGPAGLLAGMDTHGHLAGDRVLRLISDRFQAGLRHGDLIGRFGGEEIAILLPRTSGAEAGRVAERLRGHVAGEPVVVSGGREPAVRGAVTVSVGGAELAHARQDLDELLAVADAALYRAKAAGRDRICLLAPGLDEARLPVPPGSGPAAPASQ
jgi:diguanylate cyclase (GGDEF)-like protein